MNLNVEKWKPFLLKNIFSIKYGVNLELNACDETNEKNNNTVNFVSRTESNNGVSSRVYKIDGVIPQEAGLISVAGGGSVLSTFLQSEPFYSGRDLYTLECREKISDEAKQFIITIIKKNKYKYNYGRQANKTLPDLELMLPIMRNKNDEPIIDIEKKYSRDGFVPDWKFMDEYIKSIHYKKVTTHNPKTNYEIKTDLWKEFVVSDIFEKKEIKKYSSIPEQDGLIPFISSTSTDNGVVKKTCDVDMINGNCITVSTNGDCFDCFYQPDNFAISSDVEILSCSELNKYNALFICTLLKLEKPKWSYGRKPKNDKVFDTILKLPVKYSIVNDEIKYEINNGKYVIDWEYMENYIKKLPYGDRI